MKGVTANIPCLGCHHRRPSPATTTKTCETGTLDCINKVTVHDMWIKVEEMLKEIRDIVIKGVDGITDVYMNKDPTALKQIVVNVKVKIG